MLKRCFKFYVRSIWFANPEQRSQFWLNRYDGNIHASCG